MGFIKADVGHMFPERDHATYITDQIATYIHDKYQKGQETHGGNLERKELLSHAIEEAADLCVYLFTKRDQETVLVELLECIESRLEDMKEGRLGVTTGSLTTTQMATREAINILTIGNPEGVEEEEREK